MMNPYNYFVKIVYPKGSRLEYRGCDPIHYNAVLDNYTEIELTGNDYMYITENYPRFKVICDQTNNTPETVSDNHLNVDIFLFLNPIKLYAPKHRPAIFPRLEWEYTEFSLGVNFNKSYNELYEYIDFWMNGDITTEMMLACGVPTSQDVGHWRTVIYDHPKLLNDEVKTLLDLCTK